MTLRALMLALAMLLPCGLVHALTEVTGTTPGGAAYRIAVPDGWEAGDPLVLEQHPYSYSRVTAPVLGALRDTQLAQGMAVAASGYRQGGWALFTALDDNAELLDAFTARFGAPGPLYATGQRMGGLVALKLAEDPRFRDRTRGVLAMCPIVDGVQFWDQKFDVRLIVDMVCAGVPGARIPVGSAPYPWATNVADIPPGLRGFDNQEGEPDQANFCLGLGNIDVGTPAGHQERKALVKSLTRIDDDNALLTHVSYALFGLGDLVRAPDKFAGSNPFLNEAETPFGLFSVPYGNGAAGIRRVREYDPFARQRLDLTSRLDGSATARIVGIATSKDEISDRTHIRALSSIYPGVFPAANGEHVYATADETAPSQCGFSGAERLAAWDALTLPVNAPTLTAHCNARIGSGAPGPCRYRSIESGVNEEITVLHRSLFPAVYDSGLTRSSSGLWFDPLRDGEGLVIEELGGYVAGGGATGSRRHVLVSWYTYAPPGDPDPGPRWLIGVGTHTSQGVHVPSLTLTRGARFGAAFDPADVVRTDWGSLSLVVDPFHRMRVRYDGPTGWEGSERAMTMFARLDFYVFPRNYNLVSPPLPLPPPGLESASGSYFTRARDGEGVQLQVLAANAAGRRRATVQFYTYDLEGNQLWLVGLAEDIPESGGEATFAMTRAEGTVFGDTFDPGDVTRTPWGTLTLTLAADPDPSGTGFAGFSATNLRWNSVDAGYGSGGYALTRITQPHVYPGHAPPP